MTAILLIVAAIVGVTASLLGVALAMVGSPWPPLGEARDVFGFANPSLRPSGAEPPALRRYPARDGEPLAYRLYESSAARTLIFIHGSSYHGGGYHTLAATLSASGAAKVVLPNLRGHYMSGRFRGDVGYVGQLEDDVLDLIEHLRAEGVAGEVALGGHSSGGGLVLRFAAGRRASAGAVSRFLALSPIIPLSPAIKGGTAGGWSSLHLRRLFGLLALNAVGLHGFDALPVIAFNKPVEHWDGTETLAYSYRLNTAYHPGPAWRRDLGALGQTDLVMVGADDQAIESATLAALFAQHAPKASTRVLPAVDHFGIFSDAGALRQIADWLCAAA